MADAEGNVLKVPGMSTGPSYTPKEILASYARFTQKGVTLVKDQGVLATGTVLYRDPATKKYTATPVGDAKGFLRKDVDTTGQDKLGNIVVSGILKNSLLVGVVAGVGGTVEDLNARVDPDRDYFIF